MEPELVKSFKGSLRFFFCSFVLSFQHFCDELRVNTVAGFSSRDCPGRLASIAGLAKTGSAPLICTNVSTAAVARRGRGGGGFAGPSAIGIQATVAVPGACSATGAGAIVLVGRASVPPPTTDSYRQALDNTALAWPLTRVHAIIDGEIAADHVGTSGSGILRQFVGFVFNIRGVFPVVHSHSASVAIASAEGLEEGLWPIAALAKACKVHDVEHGDAGPRAKCVAIGAEERGQCRF